MLVVRYFAKQKRDLKYDHLTKSHQEVDTQSTFYEYQYNQSLMLKSPLQFTSAQMSKGC